MPSVPSATQAATANTPASVVMGPRVAAVAVVGVILTNGTMTAAGVSTVKCNLHLSCFLFDKLIGYCAL